MPIPRSVQEQADRAEALRLQIQEGKLPAEAPAAPPAPTVEMIRGDKRATEVVK